MRHAPTYAVRATLVLCGLLISPPIQSATRTSVYVTRGTCQADSLLSMEECRNAFANAEAEFNDNVPVFARQEECEKQFRRCVISFAELPSSSTVLRYVPKMRGVQVSVESEQDRTVVPILDGNHPAVSFGRRSILNPQEFRSPLRQEEARNRWASFQRQMAVPKFIEWCKRFCVALSEDRSQTSLESAPTSTLFKPTIDAGAQAYRPLETHHFRSPSAPVIRVQPRFVPIEEVSFSNREVSP